MIPCGIKETGEFKQKSWDIPEIIIQNKETIQIPREGYTDLILASEFGFLWWSREDKKKSEVISIQDGKDTINHGD